jgi:hypothetical protein
MEHKVNINLIIRMYQDHHYSVADICQRLRYSPDIVEAVIARYSVNARS